MKHLIAIFAAALILGACTSILSPKIDKITGTSKAQRCVDYRLTLANIKVLPKTQARLERIGIYEMLIATNCPPLPE